MVMSKTAKAIIIAIISEILYGLYASLEVRWSVVFFILAALGGEIVFLGLWIEKEANECEKKEHISNFLDEERSIKLRSKIGWGILMVGIGFEVLTATGLAIRDDVEIRVANANAIKNNPLNKPISEILATISFSVKESEPHEVPKWGRPTVAIMFLCESNMSLLTNIFYSGTTLPSLEADKLDLYFDGKTMLYIISFHQEGYSTMLQREDKRSVAWALEHTHFLWIMTKFLPHDAEILNGSAVLTINAGPKKWFVIPPQQDLEPNSGTYGQTYNLVASNLLTEYEDLGIIGTHNSNLN
jgi:hypothetical protein